jgi:hypothetical protein
VGVIRIETQALNKPTSESHAGKFLKLCSDYKVNSLDEVKGLACSLRKQRSGQATEIPINIINRPGLNMYMSIVLQHSHTGDSIIHPSAETSSFEF